MCRLFFPIRVVYRWESDCFVLCLPPPHTHTLYFMFLRSATPLCGAVVVNSQADSTNCRRGCGATERSPASGRAGGADTLENGVATSAKAEQTRTHEPAFHSWTHTGPKRMRTPPNNIHGSNRSALFIIAPNPNTWHCSQGSNSTLSQQWHVHTMETFFPESRCVWLERLFTLLGGLGCNMGA